MENFEEFVMARIRSFQPGKCQGSQVVPLFKGCYSAYVTDLLEANELSLWSPERSCQSWVKGKESNNEEQVDGEAGSVIVKELICPLFS